ncbi:MAG TPA: DoxX family protein [Holophagaceae bacterium]|nr:DoxX family protein [Holophagaceae bacterium]
MTSPSPKALWTGRVLTALPSLLLAFSAVMKLRKSPEVLQGFTHLGLPPSLILPLGILELACVIIYLIPRTAVLGAILVTGYFGGAMLTHLRVGEPVYSHVLFGMMIWGGLYLRDLRLRALLPLRS